MNIKIITFSGTGNTNFISQLLSRMIQNQGIKDIQVYHVDKLLKGTSLSIGKETILGVGFPVYDLKPPSIILDFINSMDVAPQNNKAFVFSTYTSYPLDSNSYVIDKLNQKGFSVIASDSFKCPGASAFFYSNPKNIMVKGNTVFEKNIGTRVQSFSRVVISGKDLLKPKYSKTNKFHTKFSEFLFGNMFYKNLKVDYSCQLCGKCIKLCPINNLDLENNNLIISKNNGCLKCLRCVQTCPTRSINFTSSKRRGDYTQRDIEFLYNRSK